MLVVCNGAFKSGSTWLFALTRCLVKPIEHVPSEFALQGPWNGTSIAAERLSEFLRSVDLKRRSFVIKSHYDREHTRELLMACPDATVLSIRRDLRDAIVSAYYHFKRESRADLAFADYYWTSGRALVAYLKRHHEVWGALDRRIYVSSYERLSNSFGAEVRRIAGFLGKEVGDPDVERAAHATSMDRMRQLWNESARSPEDRFFRKGVVGDWRSHFTPEIARDFRHINTCARAAAAARSISRQQEMIEALTQENRELRARLEVSVAPT